MMKKQRPTRAPKAIPVKDTLPKLYEFPKGLKQPAHAVELDFGMVSPRPATRDRRIHYDDIWNPSTNMYELK